MIEIEFSKHWRLQCDNPKCLLNREGQGNREKPSKLGSITTFMPAPLPPPGLSSLPRGRIKGKKRKGKKGKYNG